MSVREATPDDVPAIVGLVHELAAYERAPHEVELTEDLLADHLFPTCGSPGVWALVATTQDEEVVGTAIWFRSFSTWKGRHGIWLEDLFVRPEHRRAGHGRALLTRLAAIAVERGWPRLEWTVLDWNAPALEFYRALGAAPLEDWTTQRLSGPALHRLSSG